MAKTPAEMIAAVTRNMEKNTGKTLAQWTAILKRQGPKAADAKVKYRWLRDEQGLPHVAARIVSGAMDVYAAPAALVDAQYAGDKAALRPIYEALLRAARKLGKDVAPQPCKSYVPLRRSKTFAVIKAERARVDLGLCLGEAVAPSGRLERAGRLGPDRVTHKIVLTSARAVDATVARWLAAAYQQA